MVRQSPLGVQRAVDRVDDDEHAGVAEVDEPALLGDGGEARAVAVEAVELGEDGVLGGGVDDEREVAALAALAGLDDALRARRMVAEHRAQALGGAAAGAEPIVRQSASGAFEPVAMCLIS